MKNTSIEKSFVFQQEMADCGIACLLSVVRYYGSNVSSRSLKDLSGYDRNGTSLLGLYQAAKEIGFEAEGVKFDAIENLKEVELPCILHVNKPGRRNHYVVLYKWVRDSLLLGDPSQGLRKVTKEELEGVWSSKAALILTPNKSFERIRLVSKRGWIIDMYFRQGFKFLLITLILGLVLSFLNLSTALFTQQLIDRILPSRDAFWLFSSLVFFFMLLFTRGILTFVRGILVNRYSEKINNEITNDYYQRLLSLHKLFFQFKTTGELIARLNDAKRIQGLFSMIFGMLLIDFLSILISLGFLFSYSINVGFGMLTCVCLYCVIYLANQRKVSVVQNDLFQKYSLNEAFLIESLRGILTIKLFNLELFQKTAQRVFSSVQKSIYNLTSLNLVLAFITEGYGYLVLALLFGYTSWLVMNDQLAIGEFVAIISMSSYMMPAMSRLMTCVIQIQEAKIAIDRFHEVYTTPDEICNFECVSTPSEEEGITVSMKNLTFQFAGRKTILNNLCLTFFPRSITALVGPSGSGKTTALDLIAKFYSPTAGQLFVNSTNLKEISISAWRNDIGVVPQVVDLFSGDVPFNIALSTEMPNQNNDVLTFCQNMGFDKFFASFVNGYETLLGEDGCSISGGQRKMIGLAHALFRKPKVLLLDEVFSSMDAEMIEVAFQCLETIKSSTTIIVVTHDAAVVRRTDFFYSLNNGSICNSGPAKSYSNP